MPHIKIEYLLSPEGRVIPLHSPEERSRLEAEVEDLRLRSKALGFDPESPGGDHPGFPFYLRSLVLEGDLASEDLIRASQRADLYEARYSVPELTGREKLRVLTARRRRLAEEGDAGEWTATELLLLESEVCLDVMDPQWALPTEEPKDPILREALAFRCRDLIFYDPSEDKRFLSKTSPNESVKGRRSKAKN